MEIALSMMELSGRERLLALATGYLREKDGVWWDQSRHGNRVSAGHSQQLHVTCTRWYAVAQKSLERKGILNYQMTFFPPADGLNFMLSTSHVGGQASSD